MPELTTTDHRRDSANLQYVYPVMSRRAGGLSIGINLNTNNACNWRCVYCQVPGLVRGRPQPVNRVLLRDELTGLLRDCLDGSFFERYPVEPAQRVIRDIALSGNGEPTLAPEFAAVITDIGQVTAALGLPASVRRVLITNGSGVGRTAVRHGLSELARQGGDVWFKLDSATPQGIRRINQVHLTVDTLLRRLDGVTRLCGTYLQTCLFGFDDDRVNEAEWQAYLDFLDELRHRDIPLKGVLLYGLARPSQQPESIHLRRLSPPLIESLADAVRARGYTVSAAW